jgi:hypothetical protein
MCKMLTFIGGMCCVGFMTLIGVVAGVRIIIIK